MYINPFLAGVIATIFAEIGILFVWSIAMIIKRGTRRGN